MGIIDICKLLWPIWFFGGLALLLERFPQITDTIFGADESEDSL